MVYKKCLARDPEAARTLRLEIPRLLDQSTDGIVHKDQVTRVGIGPDDDAGHGLVSWICPLASLKFKLYSFLVPRPIL